MSSSACAIGGCRRREGIRMTQAVHLSLQNLIAAPWGPIEEENRQALGDGWELAETFVSLHAEAAMRISAAAGPTPSNSDQATILLACHGMNLFVATMGLIVRGLFDVSAHLMRGLMDTWSLLYACASRDELAARYLNATLKASEARQLLVDDLRSREQALGDDYESRLKDDADAANDLAHVKLLHGDKLVTVEEGRITPVAGGRIDRGEARTQSKPALETERWLLVSLKAFRKNALSEAWASRFDETTSRFVHHMRS